MKKEDESLLIRILKDDGLRNILELTADSVCNTAKTKHCLGDLQF